MDKAGQSAGLVARLALEERVLGAVRERILVPDVVLYAAEQAVALVLAEIRRAAARRESALV